MFQITQSLSQSQTIWLWLDDYCHDSERVFKLKKKISSFLLIDNSDNLYYCYLPFDLQYCFVCCHEILAPYFLMVSYLFWTYGCNHLHQKASYVLLKKFSYLSLTYFLLCVIRAFSCKVVNMLVRYIWNHYNYKQLYLV